MADNTLQQIQRSLGRLEGKVEEGFKGVHKRQDTTNGNIANNSEKIEELEHCIDKSSVESHESRIRKIEAFITDLRGRIAIISVLVGIAVTVVVFVIQSLLKRFLPL